MLPELILLVIMLYWDISHRRFMFHFQACREWIKESWGNYYTAIHFSMYTYKFASVQCIYLCFMLALTSSVSDCQKIIEISLYTLAYNSNLQPHFLCTCIPLDLSDTFWFMPNYSFVWLGHWGIFYFRNIWKLNAC